MRSRHPQPRLLRPLSASVLLAVVVAWFLGGVHLAVDHAHGPDCHGEGQAWTHEHDSHHAPGTEDGEPGFASATPEHHCAVLHLMAAGGGFAPGSESTPDVGQHDTGSGQVGAILHAHSSVPLLLLAPKNSPPFASARVLG